MKPKVKLILVLLNFGVNLAIHKKSFIIEMLQDWAQFPPGGKPREPKKVELVKF